MDLHPRYIMVLGTMYTSHWLAFSLLPALSGQLRLIPRNKAPPEHLVLLQNPIFSHLWLPQSRNLPLPALLSKSLWQLLQTESLGESTKAAPPSAWNFGPVFRVIRVLHIAASWPDTILRGSFSVTFTLPPLILLLHCPIQCLTVLLAPCFKGSHYS